MSGWSKSALGTVVDRPCHRPIGFPVFSIEYGGKLVRCLVHLQQASVEDRNLLSSRVAGPESRVADERVEIEESRDSRLATRDRGEAAFRPFP